MNRSATFLLGLPVVVLCAPAHASETGAIRGVARDKDGKTLSGALVVLSGADVAGELRVRTRDDGSFDFVSVPPGTHTLSFSAQGYIPIKLVVHVALDETAYVPMQFIFPAATTETPGADETIVVEETLPVIDSTRSVVSTNLSEDVIQNLPVGRSYQDVVNILPGVYGRVDTQQGGPSNGNPSVRGEGQYGNNFFVDGISTRDPATKTFGSDVNFDAIQDIQVYTDGLPAEFGQATGMLVNVVTKDGGDEHFGTAAYYATTDLSGGTYPIADLEAHTEVETEKRDFLNHELALTAGGPIKKEKLWYFASLDLGYDNISFEGMDPDAPYLSKDGGVLAKLTWFATPDLTLQYSFNGQATNIDNYETSSQILTEAQSRYKSDDLTHIVTARWQFTPLSELELKGSALNSNIDVVPMSGSEDDPSYFNRDTGEYYGNHDSFDYNDRTRLGATAKLTHMVNDKLGDHKFKLGAELWKLTDARQLVYTGAGDGYQYWAMESEGFPCTSADHTDCLGYTEYVDVGKPLGHTGNVFTGYLQDDWRPVDPVTLNLGVRVDKEKLLQNEGQEVINQWMPAPRLGAAWDMTRDSKTVLTANWGRYYDINGNTFADWADTASSFVFREYENNGDGTYTMTWEQDPQTDPLVYCTDSSLQYWEGYLVDEYGYSPEDAAKAIEKAGNYCGDGLKPYHMDKAVLGIKREIRPLLAVGVRAIMSNTVDIPEDMDIDLDTWVIANPANKRRDYRALELTVERKYDEVWGLLASYTLSESKGTTPGQFELASGGQTGSDGNNVGVFGDDVNDRDTRADYFDWGYGWLIDGLNGLGTASDDAGYYGYLPYHSFHQVKVNGFYTFEFGTTVGAVYEFDSGHAWQKRGMVDLYGDYFSFPEGRGTRFMPNVHYLDLGLSQEFELDDKGRTAAVSIDVFNVPDFAQAITNYENDDENFGLTLYRQEPRSIRAGLKITY